MQYCFVLVISLVLAVCARSQGWLHCSVCHRGNLSFAGLRFSVVEGKWEVWHVCKETHRRLDSVFLSLFDGAEVWHEKAKDSELLCAICTQSPFAVNADWLTDSYWLLWYFEQVNGNWLWNSCLRDCTCWKKCKWRDLSAIKVIPDDKPHKRYGFLVRNKEWKYKLIITRSH